jgi:hypothetical protein
VNVWNRGDFVLVDRRLAVVIGIEGDPNVPEEHLALWFGNPHGATPEVWTVPVEYCAAASPALYKH